MGQLGGRSNAGAEDARTVEAILQTVTHDLKSLHQGIVVQLSQEVAQLQAEKARLMTDIEKLQSYYQTLQSRQLETLSQQQIAQQQLWAKQLAEVLANHLQALMVQRLNQIASTHQPGSVAASSHPATAIANGHSDHAHRLLASLDTTFSTTFKALQRDLNSYQSSLSQQINRMHSLEQQGEAILEALIDRLRDQLQIEATRTPIAPQPLSPQPSIQANGFPPPASNGVTSPSQPYPQTTLKAAPIPLEFPGAPLPVEPKPKRASPLLQTGFVLVLVSTIALSIHNVVVRIIGQESTILGLIKLGGFIALGPGNALLILWLRMLVVLPLMILVAMFLYPPVWKDIKKFLSASDRRPVYNVVGSGVFLFLSQILIYIAIGKIGPSSAVTILFMYPIITVPLAWFLFGDRPTKLRWLVMATISLGVILTAFPSISLAKIASGGAEGVLTAAFSGVAFAFYLIFMQLGFKKLHPIPVSLIQFSTIFVLTSIVLTLFDRTQLGVQVDNLGGFIWGGIILGALTLIGYLTNNFGVRYMGAARASIIASSGPVMTALLAFLIIQSPLQLLQVLGILLVTGGVTALSFERMKTQPPGAKPARPA